MPDNVNQMVYAGALPWHGKGKQLPANGTFEEIREAAGFFHVRLGDLYVAGVKNPVKTHKAVVREDTNQPIAIVTDSYGVLQCDDFAETVVEALGDSAIWHTAGTLGDGAKFWLLAEIPGTIKVVGDESGIKKYVLAYSSHDTTQRGSLMPCATRVVCQNTVNAALAEEGVKWSIRHTRNAKDRLHDTGVALSRVLHSYEEFGELANALAKAKLSASAFEEEVLDVTHPLDPEKEQPRIEDTRAKLTYLFEHGTGITSRIRGTGWAALNAFTEFVDHKRTIRLTDGRERADARMENVLLGSGALLKAKALDAIRKAVSL
jgi:phage/plasmid-like protein (TIGR03299 family)